MKYSGLIFLLLAAASPTWAVAACPANPLTALAGPWTFNIQVSPNGLDPGTYAITGIMNPSAGTDRAGNPIGILTINATSLVNHSPVRLETDTGRYQINADCSGGTLTFNLSSRPMQYDFWFSADGLTMNIVSTTPGIPAIGLATRGPLGCPAGLTNPLNLLSGPYVFSLRSAWFAPILDPTATSYAIAGRFTASTGTDRGGNPIGLLSITATSQLATGAPSTTTSVTRLEADAGRFQINSDCSGGTLTFNLSSRPIQLQFYFRADLSTMDIISTTGPVSIGVARQAGPAGCPANALSVLSGPWTFNVQANFQNGSRARPVPPADDNYAATGQFVASIGTDRAGNAVGRLALNATAVLDTSITRLEGDVGSFQINDDCTGGTLTFNLSSRPQQYDFWFYDNKQSMYFVSTRDGQPFLGSAHVAPTGCPAGLGNNLNLLTGNWIFGVRPAWAVINHLDSLTQAGTMTAAIGADRANNPLGVLAITATSQNAFGSVTRLEGDAGRYTVNDDCSGGTLTFNLSSRPMQYQYYFRAGFQTFDVISTSNIAIHSWGVFTR